MVGQAAAVNRMRRSGASAGLRGLAAAARRSAILAAGLSMIVPGAGQAWAGSFRRGALVGLPLALGIAALVVTGAMLAADPEIGLVGIIGLATDPEALVAILVIDVVLLGYRLFAMLDAYRVAQHRWPAPVDRRRWTAVVSAALMLALVVGNIGIHAGVAAIDLEVADLEQNLFAGDEIGDAILPPDDSGALPGNDDGTPGPSIEPPVSAVLLWPDPRDEQRYRADASPSPEPSPSPTPKPKPKPKPVSVPRWARDGRLNVLLLGTDAGPDRWSLRTDTMILVSVDVATGRAAMFGIPRNLVNVPLPPESADAFPCRCYPRLLNSLYVYAMAHPKQFPGGDWRGFRAVAGAIQELTGIRLDGLAIVDLAGFVRVIDALGGLWITVPEPLRDHYYPNPDGSGLVELQIKAGRQHMDGWTALAYARSRHQDSDYGRMRRQQLVLMALVRQVRPCRILANLPGFMRGVKGAIVTTFKTSDLKGLLRLATRVKPSRIERYAFTPSRYPSHLRASDVKQIRWVVGSVFRRPSAPEPPIEPEDLGAC
jgi:LCP family protein required for cell wall assembly